MKTLSALAVWSLMSAAALAQPDPGTPVMRLKVTYGDQKSQFLVTKFKSGNGMLKATLNESNEKSRPLSADDVTYLLDSLDQVESPNLGERTCARANIKADYVNHGKAQKKTTCLLLKAGIKQRLVAIADLLATRVTRGPAKAK